MCSFYEKKLKPWLQDPNKSWFRLWKFILTLFRGLLLLVFAVLALYFFCQNQDFVFPKISFICLIIFNWRFIISLVLVILLLLVKLVQIIGMCLCVGYVTNRFLVRFNKLLKSTLKALNWSQLDWPCFLNLRYYIYFFDALHYIIYFVAVLVVFFVELFSLNANFPLLVVFLLNDVPFLMHITIEIFRIVQSKRVEQTIRDIFSSDLKFSSKARAMISEDQLDSYVCVHFTRCSIM